MAGTNSTTIQAPAFALTMSSEIEVPHIESGEDQKNSLVQVWQSQVEEPARHAGRPIPRLKVLISPYRYVIDPVIQHVLSVERANPERTIAVILPELVERHWYQYFLHNQRARILALRLMAQESHRIVIVICHGKWAINVSRL